MATTWRGKSLEADDEFGLSLEHDGHGRVLQVRGELDAFTAPRLADRIATVFVDRDVILDFSKVSFIDSFGLSVLVKLLADSGRRPVRLLHPHPVVSRLLQMAGLDQHPGLLIEQDGQ